MKPLWDALHVNPEDVGKLAVGAKHYGAPLTDWETLLSEIITGDAFGADRMDYLLRDSLHAGVAYGHFEHHRLIDTLRILPRREGEEILPSLGIEQGGLQSAESLTWARYFMYTQLYFHHVRRIYDYHLKQFLKAWLPEGRFSMELEQHQAMTDTEIISAMRLAAKAPDAPGHVSARRIMERRHFRLVAEITEADRAVDPNAAELLASELSNQFGEDVIYLDRYAQKAKGLRFPVLTRDGKVEWSTMLSATLKQVPTFTVAYVFVAPEHVGSARRRVAQFRGRHFGTKEPSI
jgi:HD superfamily phosphohydrolase